MTRLPSASPAPWVRLAALALLCLVWGSTWVVIQIGYLPLGPLSTASWRFWLAALGMVLVARVLQRREGGERPPPWLSAVMGTTNFAISYGIVYIVETRLPSGLVALLWATYPLVMALVGHVALPGERLRPAQALGFLTAFAGVALLFVFDLEALGEGAWRYGLLLMVSPLSVALGTAVIKRQGGCYSSLAMNRDGLFVGALLLSVAAAVREGFPLLDPARAASVLTSMNPAQLFSLIYLALVGTVLTFGLYFWLLRVMPANRLSLIAYVTPAIALILGQRVRGEAFSQSTLAGALLILIGIGLARRSR